MNQVQVFQNEQFGQMRTVFQKGEPWFVGKDIAKHLGYTNTRKALSDHVDVEDKNDGVTIRDSIGRNQKVVVINESGLYSLILSSKLPTAKKFKRWVTSEVLPAIRKTGKYQQQNEKKPDYDKLGFYEVPRWLNATVESAVISRENATACLDTILKIIPQRCVAPVRCLVREYGENVHNYERCSDRAIDECGNVNFRRYAAHCYDFRLFCEKNKKE